MVQGENTSAAVLPAGIDARKKNEQDKDDPDDKKRDHKIFPENAHDGPAEKKGAQGEQKYPDFSLHRKGSVNVYNSNIV
jgi:hypothetical protein